MKKGIKTKITGICLACTMMVTPIQAVGVSASAPTVTTMEAANAGAKKLDTALRKSLDTVIKAQKFKKTTTDKVKLKKLFNYMKKNFGYKRYMGVPSGSDWEYDFAKEMLQNKKGSCYHDAAAFALLAKRATGLPVRICIGTSNAFKSSVWQRHGWVEIKISGKWYTFDSNADRFSSRRKNKWFMQKRTSMEGKVYKTSKTYTVKF